MTAGDRIQRAKPLERQRIVDSELHRCDFIQMPFLLLEDVAQRRLQPSAAILWLYYKRRAWQSHGGNIPPNETLRETEQRSGLSRGTILAARKSLGATGWAELQVEGCRRDQLVTITLLERWDENCQGHHTPSTVQKLDKAHGFGRNPAMPVQKPAIHGRKLDKADLNGELLKTLKDVKDPRGGVGDQDTRVAPVEPQLRGMLTEVPLMRSDRPPAEGPHTAEELLEGLYRDGLKSKPPRDMRELESARHLVANGATPADAAAWASEAVTDGHIKLVTAATFQMAWPGWRESRRRRTTMTHTSQNDPWQDREPPIAKADLLKWGAL